MSLISPKQVLRRGLLSRGAIYQSSVIHGLPRSQATRIMHLLLLLVVISQLLTSQFMFLPFPGESPSTVYIVHEYVGMGSFGLVLLFWVWTLIRSGETKIRRLFPWFSRRAIGDVVRDAFGQLSGILRGHPSAESDGAFASAVHGLGLLTVTGLAVTGTVYFVTHGLRIAHYVLELHFALGDLMWAYLFGHAGIAVLHHLLGDDILRRMFWIRRGIIITTPRQRARSERHRAEV